MDRVTLQLTELRCIKQSDSGGSSEPYLWTTFFALGVDGELANVLVVKTPSYSWFRTEFPDNVKDGAAVPIPPFIASASFDFDFRAGLTAFKYIGCIAVLLEEDDTPESSILAGFRAYEDELAKQLKPLPDIFLDNGGNLPADVLDGIVKAVKDKVFAAVGRGQHNPFRDQDDYIGYTYLYFNIAAKDLDGDGTISDEDIAKGHVLQFFDFPEIKKTWKFSFSNLVPPREIISDRYVLTGRIFYGPALAPPTDHCAGPRAALKAKEDQLGALHTTLAGLELSLQTAPPGAKGAIIAEIKDVQNQIHEGEVALPGLRDALTACLHAGHPAGDNTNIGGTGGVLAGGG